MALTIGIDVGGTKVAGGVVDDRGEVLVSARVDTPRDGADLLLAVVAMAAGFAARHAVTGVGVSTAGWVDAAGDTVLFATNLGWSGRRVRELVVAELGLPVVLENDANAATWGEYRFGAGRGATSMVMVVAGTGVGGGMVVDGRPVRGAHGIAGELGHVQIVPGGEPCGCGRVGCLDAYAGGRALVRYAVREMQRDPGRSPVLAELAGGRLDLVTVPMVLAAGRRGDIGAGEAFVRVGRALGVALAGVVQVLDPDAVVVGGGLATAGALLMDPLGRAYRDELGTGEDDLRPNPTVARLGSAAGVVGAADLVRLRQRGRAGAR